MRARGEGLLGTVDRAAVPRKVQKARADPATWWQALDQASRDIGASMESNLGRVTVLDVFRLAEVPTSARLRATRLGLVWLVKHNLGKKIGVPTKWPALAHPSPRWNHPVDFEPFVRPRRKERRNSVA